MPSHKILKGAAALCGAVAVAALAAALDGAAKQAGGFSFHALAGLTLFRIAAVLGVVAVLCWIAAMILEERASRQLEWEQSLLRFEESLMTVSKWVLPRALEMHLNNQSEFQTWAELCQHVRRYPPNLSGGPLSRWFAREGHTLEEYELVALALARRAFGDAFFGGTPSDMARKAMTVELERWERWITNRISPRLLTRLKEHREAMILLAYLEVAVAERVPTATSAPEWARIGDKLPQVFKR